MHDDRRLATEQYVEELRRLGYDVELEVNEYRPGMRGLTFVEWTLIYLAAKAGDVVLDSMAHDVYEATKKLLRSRLSALRKSGRGGRPLGFVIRDEDGKTIAEWDTREDEKPPKGDDENEAS